jgi:hypothetical protein
MGVHSFWSERNQFYFTRVRVLRHFDHCMQRNFQKRKLNRGIKRILFKAYRVDWKILKVGHETAHNSLMANDESAFGTLKIEVFKSYFRISNL